MKKESSPMPEGIKRPQAPPPPPPPNRFYKETFLSGLVETEESKQNTRDWQNSIKRRKIRAKNKASEGTEHSFNGKSYKIVNNVVFEHRTTKSNYCEDLIEYWAFSDLSAKTINPFALTKEEREILVFAVEFIHGGISTEAFDLLSATIDKVIKNG